MGRSAEKSVPLPDFIPPQLATLVSVVPEGDEWLHEIKFDGYRALCRIDNGQVTFLTREAQDWTNRFKALIAPARQLNVRRAFLDGEVVALDANGRNDFQLLQNSLKRDIGSNLVYYVFDLLHFDGHDLKAAPLLERKEQLKNILPPKPASKNGASLRFSDHWIGRGQALF